MLNPSFLLVSALVATCLAYSLRDPTEKLSLADTKKGIKDGSIFMKGANLGGWLVAEHWMTSSSPAWQGVPDDTANGGEYVTMKYLGHAKGDAQFKAHRDNFYKEQDFADISAAGVNVLRIPIGYWIVGFDNTGGGDTAGWKMYAPGGLAYLDKAIKQWAPAHNLLIIINMHGAKGSQNGNDHSGPENPGHAYWAQYQENVNNTLDAVEFLARRYKDDVSFLGIGLLNEPVNQDINVLKQYYYDAYGRIRNNVGSDCLLSISPLLNQQYPGVGGWDSFMTGGNYYNLRHEWHPYYVWGYEGQSNDQIQKAARDYKNTVQSWKGNWLFIGEWSLASSATPPMNDGQMKQFSQIELDSFSPAKGYAFWAWKQYGDDGTYNNGWSMKSMLRHGYLPTPVIP